MPSSRSFPRALAAACAVASLAFAAAPAANAALNPGWLDNATLADTGSEASAPLSASSHGRTVVVWKQSDGSNSRLYASLRGTDGTWSVAEPISAAGQDLNYENYRVAADTDGDITAAWCQDGGSLPVYTRTLAKSSSEWAEQQLLAESDGAWAFNLSSRSDGSLVAWYVGGPSSERVRFRTMRPGSDTWDPAPVDIDQSGSNPGGLSVAYNASGDGIAAWAAHPDSNYLVRASRYEAATDMWSPPVDVTTPSATSIQATFLAITPAGAATVIWGSSAEAPGRNASVAAGSNTWVTQDPLIDDGNRLFSLGLASDRSGNIVSAYHSWDGSNIPTSRAWTRTRDAATGQWSPPEPLVNTDFGGIVTVSVDRNYNILATLLTSSDLSTVNVAALYRPDGANAFTDADVIGTQAFEFTHGFPAGAIDDQGNPVVVWPKHGSGEVLINAAIGDATGPELNGVSIPTSGTVGEPLSFSVSPFDLLSGLDTTSWTFGDNRDATGTSVSHTYETPGSYTVTVSARDLSGLVTTATRRITIAAQPVAEPADEPADEPDDAPAPPKVLAPVIEARLNGKTITLTARVSLRSGKSCSGKATATTSFGNTTYRTTLKLTKVDGRCIGTGTIKLKKTPSTRTKLRVTISGKSTKTRTLTTKRG